MFELRRCNSTIRNVKFYEGHIFGLTDSVDVGFANDVSLKSPLPLGGSSNRPRCDGHLLLPCVALASLKNFHPFQA